ncbi:G-type lectin S-receptor-like serine/threonine-protein kinase At4g03230 [Punica granatum]|uniref:non-specific serine/threonine protein kinase n=1 Tax=Punica granatum TaxID=22663 RepID=A0A6P8DCV0_PUNGR|nr:G-type lectin S-receptor-like serine/threonine-protein kinase At4g03230 [Punica granatum]
MEKRILRICKIVPTSDSYTNDIFRPEFFLYACLGYLLLSIPLCSGADNLTPGKEIIDEREGALVSAGGLFQLGFFSPGISASKRYIGIWYYKVSPQTVVWVANRDNPFFDRGGVLRLEKDGNLVISSAFNGSMRLTNLESKRSFNGTAQLLDSGNFVLSEVSPNGSVRVLWQSFKNPTDTLLPGMLIGEDVKLTSWKGPDDPAPGNFTFQEDRDQQNQFIIWKKSYAYPYWKTGVFGSSFPDDMPSFVSVLLSNLTMQMLSSKFPVPAMSTATSLHGIRLVISYDGEIQYFSHPGSLRSWFEPKDQCRVFNACGNFASCNSENKCMCRCLPGFEPQLPEKWNSGDFSGGCIRKSQICAGKNDTSKSNFLSLKMMRVRKPDGAGEGSNEDQCRSECAGNCSCQAYAFTSLERDPTRGKCWLWLGILSNIQEYTEDGRDLYARLALSNTELKRTCETCGANIIPYPLSTGKNCGDPSYSGFSCDNSTGQVYFESDLSPYRLTDIDPTAQRFNIQAKDPSDCTLKDEYLIKNILELDQSSPFNLISNCNYSQDERFKEIEIGWKPPAEPNCDSSKDCLDWPNTICNETGGGKSCLCKQHFKWNASTIKCVPAKKESIPENLAFRLYDSERRVKEWLKSGQFGEDEKKGIHVPFFDMEIIVEATNNFSDENKLGQGGFGPVYKGKFPGGQEIAIKRLLSSSGQGFEEFRNEVILIARLQHRNLVRLLGYCIEGDEKILLYEYMPNKSLDSFIFDRTRRALLTWEIRMEIILGIARGMLYLHHDSRLRIIHRDLKTSNVLLDEETNPKISDFGLARIFEGKQTEASTNRVIGTYGYMSPEYALDGFFSIKSDVFSFGVVVLEIISGKRNTGFYQSERTFNLLSYAWRLWNENNANDLIDRVFHETCNRTKALKCINVALLCVQDDPSDRPTMLDTVAMLSNANANLHAPKQPVFFSRSSLLNGASSSSKLESNNEISVSLEEGR